MNDPELEQRVEQLEELLQDVVDAYNSTDPDHEGGQLSGADFVEEIGLLVPRIKEALALEQ